MLPIQDCDVLVSLEFEGSVVDSMGNLISDANILISSAGESGCPNTVPIEEISLASDSFGRFSGQIASISEGEAITISVIKPNYRDYIIHGTYVLFRESLRIVLIPES